MGGPRPPDDRLGFLGSLAFEVSSLPNTEPFEECAAHTHSSIPSFDVFSQFKKKQ